MNDAMIAHKQAEPRPPIGSAMLTVLNVFVPDGQQREVAW
jgi:hypothetical protein